MTLGEFVQNHKENFKLQDYRGIYEDALIAFKDDKKQIGKLTDICYNSGINPLQHLLYIPSYFMYGSSYDKVFYVPKNIQVINEFAFSMCKLSGVIMYDGVYIIQNNSFTHCHNLTEVQLSNTIQRIEKGAFEHCREISEIDIPYSVREIGINAFNGCSGLKEVTIENKMIEIGNSAFYGCKSLKDIKFSGTKSDWLFVVTRGKHWDHGTPNYTIHCADGDVTRR